LPASRDRQDPFETDSGRVVPILTDSMPSGKPIGVFFVVYPATASEADPTITLQLYRDGHEVGLRTLPSAKRQEDGSMPMFLRLNPDPGQYDMVVTARQGAMRSEAALSVKITPSGTVSPN